MGHFHPDPRPIMTGASYIDSPVDSMVDGPLGPKPALTAGAWPALWPLFVAVLLCSRGVGLVGWS